MSDTIIVGVLFLIVVAASTFYLYSRLVYSERKISLMENILLDIKMSMEMEREIPNEDDHTHTNEKVNNLGAEGVALEPKIENVTKDDAEFYNSALESVPIESEELKSSVNELVPETSVSDALTRDELVLIAERKGLRVTKRSTKAQILALLRDTDKNSSGVPETGTDGPVGGASGSVEGASLLPVESEDRLPE